MISYGAGAGIWTRVRRVQSNRFTIWAIIHWQKKKLKNYIALEKKICQSIFLNGRKRGWGYLLELCHNISFVSFHYKPDEKVAIQVKLYTIKWKFVNNCFLQNTIQFQLIKLRKAKHRWSAQRRETKMIHFKYIVLIRDLYICSGYQKREDFSPSLFVTSLQGSNPLSLISLPILSVSLLPTALKSHPS